VVVGRVGDLKRLAGRIRVSARPDHARDEHGLVARLVPDLEQQLNRPRVQLPNGFRGAEPGSPGERHARAKRGRADDHGKRRVASGLDVSRVDGAKRRPPRRIGHERGDLNVRIHRDVGLEHDPSLDAPVREDRPSARNLFDEAGHVADLRG
jgi:hypothetical protein